jgi:cell division septation protein DedD
VTVAKATAATASKGDLGKSDVASGAGGNSGMSAEAFPEAGIGRVAAPGVSASGGAPEVGMQSRIADPVAKPAPTIRTPRELAAPSATAQVPTSSMNSGVILQVGAMRVENNASALVQDLKKKKFPAFVYQHGKDNLYRVGVGPYGDKDSSSRVKSELEKDGYKTITSKWIRE